MVSIFSILSLVSVTVALFILYASKNSLFSFSSSFHTVTPQKYMYHHHHYHHICIFYMAFMHVCMCLFFVRVVLKFDYKKMDFIIWPVDVMTGLIFACLERASMHSSLLMLNTRHSSIRWWTCIINHPSHIDHHHHHHHHPQQINKIKKEVKKNNKPKSPPVFRRKIRHLITRI